MGATSSSSRVYSKCAMADRRFAIPTDVLPRPILAKAFKFPDGIDFHTKTGADERLRQDTLARYTIFKDEDMKLANEVQTKMLEAKLNVTEDRAFGAFFGNAVGDTVGAPFEFLPVRYGVDELKEELQPEIWVAPRHNRFQLKPGQWTDDFSMAMCLADSLLVCRGFNPQDLRLRFLNWVNFGYCNAFGYDHDRANNSPFGGRSVGLGGNISWSMSDFVKNKSEYTSAGNKNTSGNGSIMRMSAVPVFFHRNIELAMDVAGKQSLTTHQGIEASECARLMAYIIVSCIHRDADTTLQDILSSLAEKFQTDVYSMQCLAASKAEEAHDSNAKLDLNDRNWNWKDKDYRYAPGRSAKQPGYIGSYAMDGMSMALHCLWTTSSFSEAVLKVANMRGDSDTTAAITAQMAGAFYGFSSIPKNWIDCVLQWEAPGRLALTAWRLVHAQGSDDDSDEKS